MAGTGKVPKPGGAGQGPETEPPDEKLPALAWIVLAVAIVLMVAGGLMVMMQFFWAGSRMGWLVGGGVLGVAGIAALSYFFDKWGKL